MTFTPVKAEQWQRTASAHRAAVDQFYRPIVWPGCDVQFEDVTGTEADYRGVDYYALVTPSGWPAPSRIPVQERFRDPSFYWQYPDITVTEWNENSDSPSELYHCDAHRFVYGYYDEQRDKILGIADYDWPRMRDLLLSGKLPRHTVPNNDRNQRVIGIDRRDLWVHGCQLHQYKSGELDGTFPGRK